VCAVTLLIAQQGPAEVIVDDFTTGLFSISTSESYASISSTNDLTGVLATQRHASAGDNGSGETKISLGEDSILRFSTDGAETLGVRWQGFTIDVTQPDTGVLVLDFAAFETPGPILGRTMSVYLKNLDYVYLEVAELPVSDLIGGGVVSVGLSALPPAKPFDLTNVNGIAVGFYPGRGTSIGLRSVRLVPEPTGLVLLSIGVCFVLFARSLR
jgi:hypothetical protein